MQETSGTEPVFCNLYHRQNISKMRPPLFLVPVVVLTASLLGRAGASPMKRQNIAPKVFVISMVGTSRGTCSTRCR